MEKLLGEMRKEYDEYNFLGVLDAEPDMSKYQMIRPGFSKFYNLWKNVHNGGGSIFSNKNFTPLRDQVLEKSAKIQKSFYRLENIKVAKMEGFEIFADIDFLSFSHNFYHELNE